MANPFQSGLDKNEQSNATIDKNIKKSKADTRKANIARSTQVLQNTAKTLAPIVALQLTNTLIQVVNQNGKLQELVDKTNKTIDAATTPTQISQATILRNSCIQIINNQEKKILSLQNTLQTISSFTQIFTIIVSILSSIPIPTAVPPGIGVPLTLITKITNTIAKAQYLIASLGVIVAIITPILRIEINNLEDLKSQLHDINGILDNKLANSGSGSIAPLSFGTNFPIYNGFKFALREENNPKFNIRGNKRHYAVAIDRDGVEVLQSDYSFTLDPNDLIEQLKLIIDQRNLQA